MVVTVTVAQAELAADVLWRAGAAAIEEQDEAPLVLLLAGYPGPEPAHDAARAVETAGFGPALVRTVIDDGLDGWRAHACPQQAGRFLLVPAWQDSPADDAGSLVLLLDPGPTFGSGSHPTTRLVLRALEDLVRPGDRVLDVGCGSGVLSVGAAVLGATSVVGIDIDPASAAVTAARNGVADRVTASDRPLATVPLDPGFEVVVANLLAPVIVELAAHLVAATGTGGALVVSGLLADRWAEAVRHLAPLVVVEVTEDEGWAAVVLRDPPEA